MTTQTLRYLVRLLCLETMGKSGGKALDGGAELLKRIKAAQDQGGAVYSPLALRPGALRVPLLAIEILPCFSASMSLVKARRRKCLRQRSTGHPPHLFTTRRDLSRKPAQKRPARSMTERP